MKSLLIATLIALTSFAFANEPTDKSEAPGGSDVVGTIQEPTAQNKKIIKKIMTRKEEKKSKTEKTAKKAGKKKETK